MIAGNNRAHCQLCYVEMHPRTDSNGHDVPAPQAGALSGLSYGGMAERTRVVRRTAPELFGRLQFSKDVSNQTCTYVDVEAGADRGLR